MLLTNENKFNRYVNGSKHAVPRQDGEICLYVAFLSRPATSILDVQISIHLLMIRVSLELSRANRIKQCIPDSVVVKTNTLGQQQWSVMQEDRSWLQSIGALLRWRVVGQYSMTFLYFFAPGTFHSPNQPYEGGCHAEGEKTGE